jgi:hypothetical protein
MNAFQSIDWGYLNERVRRYNETPTEDLLYRIGTHVDVLSVEDCQSISQQGFTSEQRYRVLNWLACCTDLLNDEMDLALLIFGRNQLEQWLERSRQAYPNYEFYLVFEYQEKFKSGFEDGINFTMHWLLNQAHQCHYQGQRRISLGAPFGTAERCFGVTSLVVPQMILISLYVATPTRQVLLSPDGYVRKATGTRWLTNETPT